MGLKDDFFRRIEKKKIEVEAMRTALRLEERYLEAMYDAYKLLARGEAASNGGGPAGFRKGSYTDKAYKVLKQVGHPMHVKDIVEAMGAKANRANKQGVASSIRLYLTKGEIFTKPAPNTYGLVEFEQTDAPSDLKEL
jgi:HB1/ASXL restriction endonuclease-like protein with HTH domain